MTVQEIIIKYLKENGYDGLYSEECGCRIDDLIPCCAGEWLASCEAGYKVPCDPETCPADGDCEWHIGPKPPTIVPEVEE